MLERGSPSIALLCTGGGCKSPQSGRVAMCREPVWSPGDCLLVSRTLREFGEHLALPPRDILRGNRVRLLRIQFFLTPPVQSIPHYSLTHRAVKLLTAGERVFFPVRKPDAFHLSEAGRSMVLGEVGDF